jgi:hypothetical protein
MDARHCGIVPTMPVLSDADVLSLSRRPSG